MKTDKFILAALVISGALALGGCSNDNEPQPQSSFPADGQVRITAGIDDLITRAGVTTDYITSQAIGFFFTTPDNNTYTYSNVKMEVLDGSWKATAVSDGTRPGPVMYWKDKETPVTVTAYSPWKANTTLQEGVKYEGVANQINDDAIVNADLVLYKSTEVNPATGLTADGEIPLTLTHVLSKVVLGLTIGEDVKEANPDFVITDVLIKGLKKDGTVTFNGSTTPTGAPDFVITPHEGDNANGELFAEPKPESTYEAIFFPQTVAPNQLSVEVTLSDSKTSDRTSDKTYVYTLGEQYTFDSNTLYTLPILVGKTTKKVSFPQSNITAKGWDTNSTDLGNKTTD